MLRHLEELAGLDEPLHLALGVFDGVHLGHRAVIGAAVEAARWAPSRFWSAASGS